MAVPDHSVQAVIFDLDGVLVDSESLHVDAWRVLFRRHGIEVTEAEYAHGEPVDCPVHRHPDGVELVTHDHRGNGIADHSMQRVGQGRAEETDLFRKDLLRDLLNPGRGK